MHVSRRSAGGGAGIYYKPALIYVIMWTSSASVKFQRQRVSASAAGVPKRDVRAMPIKLITVSKDNSKASVAHSNEWREKLER